MSRARRRLLQGVLAGLIAGPAAAQCSPQIAELVWDGGGARFRVEIADSNEERARGLMFRERMASGAGMLFIYDHPQRVAFWMKNTLIPLDMLFMDEQGRVRHIAREARPKDETPIPGGDAIRYVLEINGGLAGKLGIPEGAALKHPALDPTQAASPCR